jgi:hypothetical protein
MVDGRRVAASLRFRRVLGGHGGRSQAVTIDEIGRDPDGVVWVCRTHGFPLLLNLRSKWPVRTSPATAPTWQ